jgi:hypothetical protein
MTKRIKLIGKAVFEGRLDVLNLFDVTNFNTVNGVGSATADGFEVTGFNVSGRTAQLVGRISW